MAVNNRDTAVENPAALIGRLLSKDDLQRRREHVRELARIQGVSPVEKIEDLQGDFWPENESVDDFLDLIRAIRHDEPPSTKPGEL